MVKFSNDMLKKLGMDDSEIKASTKKPIDNSVKSPYNFVSFDEKMGTISAYKDHLPAHNGVKNQAFKDGYIKVEITTTSPLVILDNERKMKKNHEGDYIVPGSSFRGLIRQNCQILSLSHIAEDVEGDKKLTYRDLATRTSLNKDYARILGIKVDGKTSVATHVKAGYMVHDAQGYRILPALEESGKTYYPIHEAELRSLVKNHNDIQYMYRSGKPKTDFQDHKSFRDYYKAFYNNRNNNNRDYEPYYKLNVDFSFNNNSVKDIDINKGQGALLCSGFMQKKARHMLINPVDINSEPIEIKSREVISYEGFLRMNKISKEYYKLPKNGEIKPCFFIQYNGLLYFGFTQYLRLFYEHPIKAGIPNEGNIKEGYDYTESIFGFSNSNHESGYRSRVSFCDLTSKNATLSKEEVSVIMGNPKPTFYKYYLNQKDEKGTTYNASKFRLRGFKQYWLKSEPDNCPSNSNQNIITRFKPIQRHSKFSGKIYFNQMTEEEIGLLLWAIKVDPDSEYNIGFAKAYGYGSFKVSSLELHVEDKALKYKACKLDNYTKCYKETELNKFINIYKFELEKKTKRKIESIISIQEFISMKTYKAKADEKHRFEYLTLAEHKKAGNLPLVDAYTDKYTQKIKGEK